MTSRAIISAVAAGYPRTVADCLVHEHHGAMGYHHVNRAYLSPTLSTTSTYGTSTSGHGRTTLTVSSRTSTPRCGVPGAERSTSASRATTPDGQRRPAAAALGKGRRP